MGRRVYPIRWEWEDGKVMRGAGHKAQCLGFLMTAKIGKMNQRPSAGSFQRHWTNQSPGEWGVMRKTSSNWSWAKVMGPRSRQGKIPEAKTKKEINYPWTREWKVRRKRECACITREWHKTQKEVRDKEKERKWEKEREKEKKNREKLHWNIHI